MVVCLLAEEPLDELALNLLLAHGSKLGNMSQGGCLELESGLLSIGVLFFTSQGASEFSVLEIVRI